MHGGRAEGGREVHFPGPGELTGAIGKLDLRQSHGDPPEWYKANKDWWLSLLNSVCIHFQVTLGRKTEGGLSHYFAHG